MSSKTRRSSARCAGVSDRSRRDRRDRARTCDPRCVRPLLYQLSYPSRVRCSATPAVYSALPSAVSRKVYGKPFDNQHPRIANRPGGGQEKMRRLEGARRLRSRCQSPTVPHMSEGGNAISVVDRRDAVGLLMGRPNWDCGADGQAFVSRARSRVEAATWHDWVSRPPYTAGDALAWRMPFGKRFGRGSLPRSEGALTLRKD